MNGPKRRYLSKQICCTNCDRLKVYLSYLKCS